MWWIHEYIQKFGVTYIYTKHIRHTLTINSINHFAIRGESEYLWMIHFNVNIHIVHTFYIKYLSSRKLGDGWSNNYRLDEIWVYVILLYLNKKNRLFYYTTTNETDDPQHTLSNQTYSIISFNFLYNFDSHSNRIWKIHTPLNYL